MPETKKINTVTEITSSGPIITILTRFVDELSNFILSSLIQNSSGQVSGIDYQEGNLVISTANDSGTLLVDNQGNIIIDSLDSLRYSIGNEVDLLFDNA